MAKIRTKYVCQECGYETSKWLGKCPECTKWNTFVEEIEQKSSRKEVFLIDKSSSSRPVNINSIETKEEERFSTEIAELDRVLGGGIVKGSLVLVGGDPGIGKSTLLIQVCRAGTVPQPLHHPDGQRCGLYCDQAGAERGVRGKGR